MTYHIPYTKLKGAKNFKLDFEDKNNKPSVLSFSDGSSNIEYRSFLTRDFVKEFIGKYLFPINGLYDNYYDTEFLIKCLNGYQEHCVYNGYNTALRRVRTKIRVRGDLEIKEIEQIHENYAFKGEEFIQPYVQLPTSLDVLEFENCKKVYTTIPRVICNYTECKLVEFIKGDSVTVDHFMHPKLTIKKCDVNIIKLNPSLDQLLVIKYLKVRHRIDCKDCFGEIIIETLDLSEYKSDFLWLHSITTFKGKFKILNIINPKSIVVNTDDNGVTVTKDTLDLTGKKVVLSTSIGGFNITESTLLLDKYNAIIQEKVTKDTEYLVADTEHTYIDENIRLARMYGTKIISFTALVTSYFEGQ